MNVITIKEMVAATLTLVVLLLNSKSFFADTLVEVITSPLCNLICRPVARENVTFLQYLPSGDRQQINSSDSSELNKQIIFVIHGWKENATMGWIPLLADSLYKTNLTGNVIAVNWSTDAALDYFKAAPATCGVGKLVADFIVTNNITYVQIVGHSLGAHVAANVGQNVLKSTGNKIERIWGLDPASPFFETMPPQCRIDKEDAKNVHIIHTQVGAPGMILPCGKIDFYVNFGLIQSSCTDKLPDLSGLIWCGHRMSKFYFIMTVRNPKKYYGCSTDGEQVYMGYGVSPDAVGLYNIIVDKKGNQVFPSKNSGRCISS